MLSRAVVLSPSANFSKGLTSAMLGAPVYAQALKQHEAYCAALEECGLQLLRLEAGLIITSGKLISYFR